MTKGELERLTVALNRLEEDVEEQNTLLMQLTREIERLNERLHNQ